jgi:hypothetical protein
LKDRGKLFKIGLIQKPSRSFHVFLTHYSARDTNRGRKVNRDDEQTRQADEIVIVDGGSNDNTVDILHRYEDRLPIQVIVQAGCNISEGRNTAIATAKGDILARYWFSRL